MGITRAGKALRRKLTPTPTLTQAQLAERLGVTQQAISAWMRGVSRPEDERRTELEKIVPECRASDWDEEAAEESGPSLGADESGEHAALDPATTATG